MKGLTLSNSEKIRTVHNSFARAEPFYFDSKKKGTKSDDVYHFVSYVPFKGKLYELDGLQPGPILLGGLPEDGDWISLAKTEINKRIRLFEGHEIRFNLLALCESQAQQATGDIKLINLRKSRLFEAIKQKRELTPQEAAIAGICNQLWNLTPAEQLPEVILPESLADLDKELNETQSLLKTQ